MERRYKMDRQQIYRQLIDKFGERQQIIVAIEELSELQKELCKWLRDNNNIDNIVEELADVYIMLQQLELIFDIDLLVLLKQEKKLERTVNRYLQ